MGGSRPFDFPTVATDRQAPACHQNAQVGTGRAQNAFMYTDSRQTVVARFGLQNSKQITYFPEFLNLTVILDIPTRSVFCFVDFLEPLFCRVSRLGNVSRYLTSCV